MIWLIGNKGMLGSEIEKLLKLKKIDYFATDKDCDITDPAALSSAAADKKIDWIINCSAYTAVDAAEDNEKSAFRINSEGVGNIADIAGRKNAVLIHISTDYVFSGSKKEPYKEEDKPDPESVYGASKASGEKLIMERLKKFFIIRTAWLYGKNGKNFVNTMLTLFTEKERIRVVNDQFGSPTYAADLAKTVIEIVNGKSEEYGIYHFTNGGETTWFDFAREIYRKGERLGILSKPCRIEPVSTDEYPTKAKRPAYSLLSKEKIKNKLNITVPHWKNSLEDYLKKENMQ